MFSSCCRCVNKKAILKDEQLSENESDDSKSEKLPADPNLIQKIPLRDPNTSKTHANNGVKTESVNVIDTVIKEEAEEDITSPSSNPSSLIDKGENCEIEDDVNTGETKHRNNIKENDSSIRSANTLNLVGTASSNISDEEKQTLLQQQQQASTDNEDDGTHFCFLLFFFVKFLLILHVPHLLYDERKTFKPCQNFNLITLLV